MYGALVWWLVFAKPPSALMIDPFMRFRMTLNDYDAILSVATETPRCTLVVVATYSYRESV